MRAFKRRAGGGRTGEHLRLVPQQNLGIGADIHDQHGFLGLVRLFGQRHRRAIRPDMPRDARQQIDPRGAVHRVEFQLACIETEAARRRQSERGLPQFHRINAQQQMMHHRIADKHQFINRLRVRLGLHADRLDQGIQCGADGGGHFTVAAGVHHRITDAAHQILAKPDLRVHHARRGQNRPGVQIAQMRRDGGGAKVDGKAEDFPLVIPRPDVQQAIARIVIAFVQGDGDFPCALAQRGLQAAHQAQLGGDALDLPLLFQRPREAFEIPGRLVHVGLVHLDVQKPRCRVHLDHPVRGRLADDLLVDLTFRRHVDDHIAHDLRLTAQAAPVQHAANALVARLDLVPLGQRAIFDMHAVLGKFAIARRDLALGANAAPATDRIEIDAKLPRRRQHRRAMRKPPPLARGGEDHKGFVGHGRLLRALSF